jgi:hypothetical protein
MPTEDEDILSALDTLEDEGGPPTPVPPGKIRMPVPDIPLPLRLFFGMVKIGDTPVLLCTAINPSGSMTQGLLTAEEATKIGRDLLQAGRSAMAATPPKLIVPGDSGLLIPVAA